MPRPLPSAHRTAHPLTVLSTVMWPLFLACSALMAAVWLTHFGTGSLADPAVARTIPNSDLRSALAILSRSIDGVWVILGAINVYLALARTEGLATARRSSGFALLAAFGAAAVSVRLQWPLGAVYYPPNLGWKIGPVPLAYPFLWFAIIFGARDTILRLLPNTGYNLVAVCTGAACALTDWLLEPIAWKYRAWWLWYPGNLQAPSTPPATSYAFWFVAGAVLALLARPSVVSSNTPQRPVQPAIVYLVANALFVATRLAS